MQPQRGFISDVGTPQRASYSTASPQRAQMAYTSPGQTGGYATPGGFGSPQRTQPGGGGGYQSSFGYSGMNQSPAGGYQSAAGTAYQSPYRQQYGQATVVGGGYGALPSPATSNPNFAAFGVGAAATAQRAMVSGASAGGGTAQRAVVTGGGGQAPGIAAMQMQVQAQPQVEPLVPVVARAQPAFQPQMPTVDFATLRLPDGTAPESKLVLNDYLTGQISQLYERMGKPAGASPSPVVMLNAAVTSSNVQAREMGLRIGTHLTSDATNQKYLAQTVLLPSCIQTLNPATANDSIIQFAVMCVCNLSMQEGNGKLISQAGGVQPLAYLLWHQNPQIKKQVMWALSHVLKDENSRPVFRDAGGIGGLIEIIGSSPGAELELIALKVLALQGYTKPDKMEIFRVGGCAVMAQLLCSDNAEIVKLAMWTVANLATERSQLEHLRNSGALPMLVQLLGSADPFVVEQVAITIANLAINETNCEVLREAGAIPKLVDLMSRPSDTLVFKTIGALANMLVNERCQIALVQSGGLQKILPLLSSDKPPIRGKAALSIVNLTQHNDQVRKFIGLAGAVPSLISLLSTADFDCAVRAVQSIVNLALNPQCLMMILDTNTVEKLVALLACSVPELQESALLALFNLSQSDMVQDQIRQAEGIPRVIMLLAHPKPPVQLHALKLLSNLALNGKNRAMMQRHSEVMSKLQQMHYSPIPLIKSEAEVAVKNLSFPVEQSTEHRTVNTKMQDLLAKRTAVEEGEASASASSSIGVSEDIDAITPEKELTEEEFKAKEEKYHQKRMNTSAEILVTERSYVTGLDTMVQKYMLPMMAEANNPTGKKPLLTPEQVRNIFSIAETIHGYHKMLLDGLEARIGSYDENMTIGDYFLTMSDFMRTYTQYVNNYNIAVEVLDQLEKNPEFVTFLRELTVNGIKGQKLHNYLIMPIQRIPRYVLLLTDYQRRTRQDHPDYKLLGEAAEKINTIANYVDERKDLFEKARHVVEVDHLIRNIPGRFEKTVVAPGRIILKEGTLEMTSGGSVYLFLFNDCVLLTKEQPNPDAEVPNAPADTPPSIFSFINRFPLKAINFINHPDAMQTRFMFEFRTLEYSFQLMASNASEKNDWVKIINEAIKNLPNVRIEK
eukprot:CAMPEP_0177640894 /NCGR_PEP_ID=MMETSP0447-20121125/6786_1 /TAXON_ID=0 /ORGANISM="Stygamoeba regulata, Strain BSH-02190019" /LENGTH=1125 /DNA_ID=CAMNT_0019142995 /DNA_START=207 /DNA_END=3585 /DNA_ORIENTATION=+